MGRGCRAVGGCPRFLGLSFLVRVFSLCQCIVDLLLSFKWRFSILFNGEARGAVVPEAVLLFSSCALVFFADAAGAAADVVTDLA